MVHVSHLTSHLTPSPQCSHVGSFRMHPQRNKKSVELNQPRHATPHQLLGSPTACLPACLTLGCMYSHVRARVYCTYRPSSSLRSGNLGCVGGPIIHPSLNLLQSCTHQLASSPRLGRGETDHPFIHPFHHLHSAVQYIASHRFAYPVQPP